MGSSPSPRDAYLHVPIHPGSRQYLKFRIGNQSFQLRVLSFGFATNSHAHCEDRGGIHEHTEFSLFFLDDFLFRGETKEALRRDLADVRDVFTSMGSFVINDKSRPTPTQNVQFWVPIGTPSILLLHRLG